MQKNEFLVFTGYDTEELQNNINEFFNKTQETEFKVIDVRFSTIYIPENGDIAPQTEYSALIRLENLEPDEIN